MHVCNLVTADLKQPRRQPTIAHAQNEKRAVKDRGREVGSHESGEVNPKCVVN